MKNRFEFLALAWISLFLVACSNSAETAQPEQLKKQEGTKLVKTSDYKTKIIPIDTFFIHQNFKYSGAVKERMSWIDSLGSHLVFTTETGIYRSAVKEDDETYLQNAELACYHYLRKEKGFDRHWKITDFSVDCPVDATAHFCKKSLKKTDLDKDGTPEIWVVYRIACRGDVSPSETKIIMYEGKTKYKIAGESRMNVGNNEFYGGEIKSQSGFDSKPKFYSHAKKLWDKYKNETFDE